MDMRIKNRRRFHRIQLDERININCIDDTRYDQCRVQNISFGGLCIEGDFLLKEGENCQICLAPNAKSVSSRLRATATVIWNSEKTAGLKFTSMTHDSYMSLLSTLINNAEQPAIIFHEFPKTSPFEITSI